MSQGACLVEKGMEPIHDRVQAKAAVVTNLSDEAVRRVGDVVGKIVGCIPPREAPANIANRDGQIHGIDALLDQVRSDLDCIIHTINTLERGE